jgi:hypothetical protein
MSEVQLPSNRSFGTLFVTVFAIIGGLSWWNDGTWYPYWIALSALTGTVTLLAPAWLTPLNRAWMKLAEILNRIVSPIVLGVIFFVVMLPFGLVMRIAGRDPLRRRYEPAARSYWIPREPPGPPPESLKDQF